MAEPVDFAQNLKQQADIVRVIGDYVKLRKSGAVNFTGLCPFHNEKSPSFSVHVTKQFFHCFGCGASGDVYSFLQKIDNISFPEAVKALALKLGVPMPKQAFSGPGEAADAALRGKLIDIHERATAFFQEQLRAPEAAKAREYLAGRGLDAENIARFRIGFAPDSGFALRDRVRGSFDDHVLRQSGLFSWKDRDTDPEGVNTPVANMYSRFRNRITFPICSEQGKVIAFTARTLETGEKAGPKYLNSPETALYSKSRVLFNLDKAKEVIRKVEYVILVEGQMDCITVFTSGFQNVIASSGTAFTETQVQLLKRFTRNIIVNFDPDTAGAAAAERSIAMLLEEDFDIRLVSLEPGFDPDLFIRKKGKDAYREVLGKPQRYFDWLIERALKMFPPRSPEARVKAINYLLPHIQRIPNAIVRDDVAKNAAQKFGIADQILRQQLRDAAGKRSGTIKSAQASGNTVAEKVLICALTDAANPELRQRAVEAVAAELHRGLNNESMIERLSSISLETDPMSLDWDDAQRQELAGVLIHGHEDVNEALLDETLYTLRQRRMEQRKRELNAEIAEAERRSDSGRLGQLLAELKQLEREQRPQ